MNPLQEFLQWKYKEEEFSDLTCEVCSKEPATKYTFNSSEQACRFVGKNCYDKWVKNK